MQQSAWLQWLQSLNPADKHFLSMFSILNMIAFLQLWACAPLARCFVEQIPPIVMHNCQIKDRALSLISDGQS